VKPYNPIIGEQFYCSWDLEDSETKFYAEQVSHHPPVMCCFMETEKKNLKYKCTVEAGSTFTGNSAQTILLGEAILEVTNLKGF
jgi:hypothetical protein